MRSPITTVVADMKTPTQEERTQAAQHGGSQSHNDTYQRTWPCLTTIEAAQPPLDLPLPRAMTVAAWNMERCKRVEDSADLLQRSGADVVLATEMDWGMARSAQRHTTRALAHHLGFGYVYGVEFVELGTGDPYETSLFEGVPNDHGLHGNAILSRYPMTDLTLIPLDEGGTWYVGSPKNDGQFRVGGRMAIAARVGGIVFVAAHYESESDAHGRAAQTARLLQGLDAVYGDGPMVIGGDLNTRAFADAHMDRVEILNAPQEVEPSFAAFQAAGFDWRTVNTGAPTLRAAPGKKVWYPLHVLDWLYVRGLMGAEPCVVPAVSPRGDYLSDHELITARVLRPG